jgi:hypothetical protein
MGEKWSVVRRHCRVHHKEDEEEDDDDEDCKDDKDSNKLDWW